MTDDLADLHRLDRALDELNASQGNGPLGRARPRDAEHDPEPSGSGSEGEPTVELDTTPSPDQHGAPTQELDGSAPVSLNGHRPAAPATGAAAGDDLQLVDALAATAAELRASVPAPRPEAAARGREAFLASTDRFIAAPAGRRRRRMLLRAAALAAALLLVGIPGALARQALPGSPLYRVHQATQDARLALTSSPVSRARILLDEAERMRDEAVSSASERDRCVRVGRDDANQALATLQGVGGAAAQRQVARANALLHDFHDLAEGKLPGEDHGGSGRGDDHSGRGGDDSGGDRHGGSGSSGSGSGGGDDHSGSGSSGSGSGSGGSGSGSGSGSSSTSGGSGSGSSSTSGGSGSGF
ncbi:MAG TPA: hypothetical protein VGA45_19630, partial [Actinomycetota bacterium]